MTKSLEAGSLKLTVYTLGGRGYEVARLDNGLYEGRWRGIGATYLSETLLAEVLNSGGDADAILRLTKRFGNPLASPTEPNQAFGFNEGEWLKRRQTLRGTWDRLAGPRSFSFKIGSEWQPGPQDLVRFAFGELKYRAGSLYQMVLIAMALLPRSRFQKCKFERCPAPYFYTEKVRRKYCGRDCAQDAENKAKLDWWNRNRKK